MGCPTIPVPTTLKTALEFTGALGQGNLKGRVGKQLEKRISEYSDKLVVASNFRSTLDNLKQLREKLDKKHSTFGSYSNLQSQTVECLADTVADCFPKLYCTLYYFNFNVSVDAYDAGEWKNQSCSSGNLQNWLKGNSEIPSASGPSSQAKLWSGGFHGGDIKCRSATEFSSEMGTCVEDNGSKFPMLLSGILFLKPSLPELTSTFLVLVKEICIIVCGEGIELEEEREDDYGESRKTLQKKFKSVYGSVPDYASLKLCCSSVKSSIEKLIGKEPGGDNGALRIPNSSRRMYMKKLQSKNFPKYLQWLSQNLERLIENLKQMKSDCQNWKPSDMSKGQAPGPFPYGFAFFQSWNQGTAQTALSALMGDENTNGLPALQGHVNKLLATSTSSSAGSIAGSLLGTAAVGGAGAAVAFNVGGVTTALKGAIGIFK
ncbi:secreted antigen 1 [Babesia caballi]|uniref:Secreted antigen 1 n=1 Tax=Babesia caballi TaxID=5871 RepID=A0AAV4LPQ1_BABCB|nr:secreted antigen 1 [Babesia caballi]